MGTYVQGQACGVKWCAGSVCSLRHDLALLELNVEAGWSILEDSILTAECNLINKISNYYVHMYDTLLHKYCGYKWTWIYPRPLRVNISDIVDILGVQLEYTVWVVIFVRFKFLWILWCLLVHKNYWIVALQLSDYSRNAMKYKPTILSCLLKPWKFKPLKSSTCTVSMITIMASHITAIHIPAPVVYWVQ